MRSEIPIKCPKRDKSVNDIVCGLGSSLSVVKDENLNNDHDELNEVLDCGSTGVEVSPENTQSAQSTSHIRNDHAYCYGWTAMDNPN